jgi:hypothetical protein
MAGFSETPLLPTLHVCLCKALSDVFGNRNISNDIWPARSPVLNPCDFFFWDCLKSKVYSSNIRREISNIPAEHLEKVNQNLFPVRGMSTCKGTEFSTPPICEHFPYSQCYRHAESSAKFAWASWPAVRRSR